jgi:hypothetical protein
MRDARNPLVASWISNGWEKRLTPTGIYASRAFV